MKRYSYLYILLAGLLASSISLYQGLGNAASVIRTGASKNTPEQPRFDFCGANYDAWNDLERKISDKAAACSEMDWAERMWDKYESMIYALKNIFAHTTLCKDGCDQECNYINGALNAHDADVEQWKNTYFLKKKQCEAQPPLYEMESSASTLANAVCAACNNSWPPPRSSSDFFPDPNPCSKKP